MIKINYFTKKIDRLSTEHNLSKSQKLKVTQIIGLLEIGTHKEERDKNITKSTFFFFFFLFLIIYRLITRVKTNFDSSPLFAV